MQSVIREHGALMVVSLDGRMDAETASDAATPGKASPSARGRHGICGRIEIRRGNTLTVTLTDNGPVLGAKADILLDGVRPSAPARFYAHSAWNVTAAAARSRGSTPPWNGRSRRERRCSRAAWTPRGEYRRLSQLHRDYEDTMLKLFRLYQTRTVTASAAGRVSDLDTAHLGVMRNTGSYTAALLASPSEAFRRNPPSVRRFSPRSRSAKHDVPRRARRGRRRSHGGARCGYGERREHSP